MATRKSKEMMDQALPLIPMHTVENYREPALLLDFLCMQQDSDALICTYMHRIVFRSPRGFLVAGKLVIVAAVPGSVPP
jgi:hypothetical protein